MSNVSRVRWDATIRHFTHEYKLGQSKTEMTFKATDSRVIGLVQQRLADLGAKFL